MPFITVNSFGMSKHSCYEPQVFHCLHASSHDSSMQWMARELTKDNG